MMRTAWTPLMVTFVSVSVLFIAAVAGALLKFWALPIGQSLIEHVRVWLLSSDNIKIAGLLVTVVTGTLTATAAWSYRVDTLPGRLNTFIDSCTLSIMRERAELVAEVPASLLAQKTQQAPQATNWARRRAYRQRAKVENEVAALDRAPIDPDDEATLLQKRFDTTRRAQTQAAKDLATLRYVRALDYLRLAQSGHDEPLIRAKARDELEKASRR
jgi:hypothetical protein